MGVALDYAPSAARGQSFDPGLDCLPFVFLAMGLISDSFTRLRIYLVINRLVVVLPVPLMAGFVAVDLSSFQGRLQYILAACMSIPVGLVNWHGLGQTSPPSGPLK